MSHNPYTCDECIRLGWNHTDDEEPWPTWRNERRRSGLISFGCFLAAMVIAIAVVLVNR